MVKMMRRLTSKDWMMAGVAVILIVFQVGLDLQIPNYMSEITRLVQTPGSPTHAIWQVGGYMMLCALGSVLCMVGVGFFTAKIAAALSRKLRSQLYDRVDSFSMQEINHFSTSSLITRSTNDVSQVQMFLAIGMQFMVKSPIMAVWALSKIYGKSHQWTTATLIAVFVMVVIVCFLMLFVMPKFKKMQTLTDDLNRVVMEHLNGLRVVRAYNAEAYQEQKFDVVNQDLTNTHLFTSRAMSIMMPVISAVMSGLSLAIYLIGAVLIDRAQMMDQLTLFSDMIVFSSYAMQVVMSFLMMVMIFIQLPRASVSARRINEVLETEPGIRYGNTEAGLPQLQGEISFRNVSFRYPGAAEYVLQDISFTAKQGESVAFIGSTGSGKSTLIHLITRFFDPTEGEIFLDGIPIQQYAQKNLYDKMGYVPQKAVLFTGTVHDNVAYGEGVVPVYTEEHVKKALKIAQGNEFVEKMQGQYHAPIARNGMNVSGGQKQRIAIARAICRKPEIYIFDDSFSALDYKTDRVLRTALKQETAGVTSLIVAQRIGTIMDADQIIVLDEGQIVGQGKHKELLASCEIYKQIAKSQLSEEELVS